MAQSSPETNMALLANAAELTRLTVSAMMSNEKVRNLFGQPAARENQYQSAVLAVHNKLSGALRNMPTGQFNKSVTQGSHTSGAQGYPNVSA